MQRSASPDNTTSQVRRSTKWELPGLAKLGITSMGLGVLALAGPFLDGHDRDGIDIAAVTFLALGVTLMLGGLQTIRWGVSAQKGRAREEMFTEDLFAIEQSQMSLTDQIREFITAETTQSGRSREARERLERVERVLIRLAASLDGAADFGDRLHAIERNLDTLTRAIRETRDEQSKEASKVEVRLDGITKQLASALEMLGKLSLEMPAKPEVVAEVKADLLPVVRDEAKAAAKAERVAGYLDDVRGRLGNSGGPDLRVVRRDGDD